MKPKIKKIFSENNDFQHIEVLKRNREDLYDTKTNLTNPMALLIGNETYGLSNSYKSICDTLIKIPMSGHITSFNVACAASIILYEIDRQRKNII